MSSSTRKEGMAEPRACRSVQLFCRYPFDPRDGEPATNKSIVQRIFAGKRTFTKLPPFPAVSIRTFGSGKRRRASVTRRETDLLQWTTTFRPTYLCLRRSKTS